MHRYFTPKVDGELKCSPEALKMWKDKKGRQELKKMFLQHGSFQMMEIRIKKRHVDSSSTTKSGGWYTKSQLDLQHGWTKQMINRAFAWAEKNGKYRVNPIHGEPEAFLVLNEGFCLTSTDTEETDRSGNIAVQDEAGTLFDSELPDIGADHEALLAYQQGDRSALKGDGSNGDPSVSVGNTSGVMSFKKLGHCFSL
ncbi:Uncharacterized protein SCF082_LOCUS6397 [Durusdinium trenchii]|uniref:Uncharacterized protein n=1 Tax=Durusdinium trenchii TaxID=1381693 RepID=A0ABP0ICA3_9DINO